MIAINQRPFTPEEKNRLASILPGFWNRIQGFVGKLLIVFMFSFVPVLLLEEFVKKGFIQNGFFAFGWALLILVIALLLTWREEKKSNRLLIISDIEAGEAQVHKIEVQEACVAMIPKSGWVYFLKTEKDKTLLINSKVYEILELMPKTFPSSKMEISLSPQTQYFLAAKLEGDFIPAEHSVLKEKSLINKFKGKKYLSVNSALEALITKED